jgi:hypothetical protein
MKASLNWTAEEQAWLYIDAIPRAMTGHGGDQQTYKVCSVLVNDFALGELQAWPLLREWNDKCLPPWSDHDLRTKLHSAMRCAHPKPRGNKLRSDPWAPAQKQPVASGFTVGSQDQLRRLAALRDIGPEGLEWAQERGLLVFGRWHEQECYGVTDSSKNCFELRRLDGKSFPAFRELSERKSHALAGSNKKWPLGILEAKAFPYVALVEGLPDLLAAHYIALSEQASHYSRRDVRCAPVAMLSATPDIDTSALSHFKDKWVRIFPHADESGIGLKGAAKWHRQLSNAGVRCDLFDLTRLRDETNGQVKDLNDFVRLTDPSLYLRFPQLLKIMPDANHGK